MVTSRPPLFCDQSSHSLTEEADDVQVCVAGCGEFEGDDGAGIKGVGVVGVQGEGVGSWRFPGSRNSKSDRDAAIVEAGPDEPYCPRTKSPPITTRVESKQLSRSDGGTYTCDHDAQG
jgi:hypothetical protein